jgi:hypothetical protein
MPQGCKAQALQSWPHKGPCWWLNTACEPCGVGIWRTIRSSASGPVAVADCCSSQALSAYKEFHDRPGAAWTWQAVHGTTTAGTTACWVGHTGSRMPGCMLMPRLVLRPQQNLTLEGAGQPVPTPASSSGCELPAANWHHSQHGFEGPCRDWTPPAVLLLLLPSCALQSMPLMLCTCHRPQPCCCSLFDDMTWQWPLPLLSRVWCPQCAW